MAEVELERWGGLARTWTIVQVYSAAQTSDTLGEVAEIYPCSGTNDFGLRVSDKLAAGDLVMVCGAHPRNPEDLLYRIYEVRGGTEKPIQVSDDSSLKVLPIGLVGQQWWEFVPGTGDLQMIGTPYQIGPDCPLNLKAVAKNWSWEEHFDAVVDIADGDDFAFSDQPEAAAKLVAIFSAFIRQGKQQARDAARNEELSGAIREISVVIAQLAQPDPENHLAVLVKHSRDEMRHWGLGIRRKLGRIMSICLDFDAGFRRSHQEHGSKWVIQPRFNP